MKTLEKKEYKTCPECEKSLSRTDNFGIRNTKHGVFLRSLCLACEREKGKLYREKNAGNVAFRLKRNVSSYKSNLVKKYGIDIEFYNKLLEKQEGKCSICLSEKNKIKNRDRLEVDHCHSTGKIRGLLCSSCNRALGLLGEDSRRLKRALEYLEIASLRQELNSYA